MVSKDVTEYIATGLTIIDIMDGEAVEAHSLSDPDRKLSTDEVFNGEILFL